MSVTPRMRKNIRIGPQRFRICEEKKSATAGEFVAGAREIQGALRTARDRQNTEAITLKPITVEALRPRGFVGEELPQE